MFNEDAKKELARKKQMNLYSVEYDYGFYDGFLYAQQLPYHLVDCDHCSGFFAIEKNLKGENITTFSSCVCAG